MSIRYLVAGTGRSGTGYLARLLTLCGSQCGHETILDHDLENSRRRLNSDQWRTGDSSLATYAYLDLEELAGIPVLHVIREPLAVVASWRRTGVFAGSMSSPYGRFIAATIPEVLDGELELDRIITYVVRQTELTELRATGPYTLERLEDLTGDPYLVATTLLRLGASPPPLATIRRILDSLPPVNITRTLANVVAHPREPLEWSAILKRPTGELLLDHALRFGYAAGLGTGGHP